MINENVGTYPKYKLFLIHNWYNVKHFRVNFENIQQYQIL